MRGWRGSRWRELNPAELRSAWTGEDARPHTNNSAWTGEDARLSTNHSAKSGEGARPHTNNSAYVRTTRSLQSDSGQA